MASLLLFRSRASSLLHLVATDTEEEDERAMDCIAQKIAMESRDCSRNGSVYQTKIYMDIALQPVSPTLLTLLTKVSGKLGSKAQGAMIGNIITNVISNKPTPLQVALSVLLSKKTLIEELHYFRVCCSYDEYLRFKASAAKAAEAQIDLRGLLNAKEGLIQVVEDNFDSNIIVTERIVIET